MKKKAERQWTPQEFMLAVLAQSLKATEGGELGVADSLLKLTILALPHMRFPTPNCLPDQVTWLPSAPKALADPHPGWEP